MTGEHQQQERGLAPPIALQLVGSGGHGIAMCVQHARLGKVLNHVACAQNPVEVSSQSDGGSTSSSAHATISACAVAIPAFRARESPRTGFSIQHIVGCAAKALPQPHSSRLWVVIDYHNFKFKVCTLVQQCREATG